MNLATESPTTLSESKLHTVFIHGATASSQSFAYIRSRLNCKNVINLDYDRCLPAHQNLEKMVGTLSKVDDELYFVCHSLGGIYAVYLQDRFQRLTKGVCSLSTPFNGSEVAYWTNMFLPNYQLFKDITPISNFISKSRQISIKKPWTQFVTTVGDVPWLLGENDGIVTYASMTCRDDVDMIPVKTNHYEILQNEMVIDFLLTHMTQHTKEKSYV